MFTILLIAAALGASCSYEDDTTCVADPKCRWYYSESEGSECYTLRCNEEPTKTLCERYENCQWKSGACSPVECYRHSGNTCPTDKGCQKFDLSEDVSICLPSGLTPKQGDRCTETGRALACKNKYGCEWKSDKCADDGCSKSIQEESECDITKCQLVNEGTEDDPRLYCYSKSYDPDNSWCYKYATGVECDDAIDCMTIGTECKQDKCMYERDEADCKANKDCVWGMPAFLKDFYEADNICLHKDHVITEPDPDSTLGIFPVMIQSKIFQIASALLLFVLI